MRTLRTLIIAACILAAPRAGSGDIIVTMDDMTLNGKILEDVKNVHVKIGNYHGVFTIPYPQIKEMYTTGTYQEDIRIYNKMGRPVSEFEIKTNYQAGVHKLKKQKNAGAAGPLKEILLLTSPYFIFNLGKIRSVLPYGAGASVLGDLRFNSGLLYLPCTIRLDIKYLHSFKGAHSISAYRFGLGAAWIIPLAARGYHFALVVSPVFGTGYYLTRGRYEKTANFKFDLSVSAGPEFYISSWVISPQARFEYVYDGAMPLYGVGFSLGAGYLFKI